MLKYCEQYRNMRESLCREHARTDYCRRNAEAVSPPHSRRAGLQITSLPCDEFPAQTATKSCSLAKDGTVKSKSDEEDGIEKQHRRPSVNFEKEFTFTPRLNLASVRMARERTGKARESIERRANALVAEVQMKFTFKPKVSSRSEKIAQGLKTSFFERQLIHVERQRKMSVSHEIMSIPSQGNQGRLIPAIRPRKQKKSVNPEQGNSERLAQGDCKADEIQKTELTKSAPDFRGQHEKSSTIQQPADQNRLTLWRHRRLKTYPGASSEKDGVLQDDAMKTSKVVMKPKQGHRKASTVSGQIARGAQYHNMPQTFKKLRETKETAENAMKNRKVFVCHGPYPVVRASLRKRGWIEKHFKGCPAVVSNSNKEKASSSDNEDDDGADSTEKGGKSDNSGKEDDDGDESTVWSAGYEGEDCEYSLLSRFCRNATASLFWTCKRDDIDFKYLRKDQIANHFSKAYSFTTKVGLCTHLRNLAWFEDASSDDFFPRCHRLGSDDEKEAFIDDYRMTSACNILKLLINRSNDQSQTSTHTTVKAKSSITLRATIRSRTQRSPSCSANSQRSRSSLASGERRSVIGQTVPSRAILLALRACRQFIVCRNNEDIDGQYENAMLTDEDWENLIGYYYQIIHNGSTIEGGEDYIERCKEMLQEMRKLLPQLDLDGFRNVWIVKPGAKSRGRGIMCMDRLEDLLKLVSSTVKKENRWIAQKYIESPLLIYNTKFDIRQWFLVTDWNPLTLWFYKDCYFRFCSQEFTLDNFEPCVHLANNSIQKHYQNGVRDDRLPENNMWSSDDFRDYLRQRGEEKLWEEVIYPGMRQAIVYTLESCQLSLEARKNSFELYGADFMLTEDYKPWLIEINSSPAMGASTTVTRKLCANVIEDTMKVILDRKEDKNCDTGRFELAFKQPFVDAPPYIGINLAVNGKAIHSPNLSSRRQPSANRIERLARPREKNPLKCNEYDTMNAEDDTMMAQKDSVNGKHDTSKAENGTEKTDNATEKADNDAKGKRTRNDESKSKDMTGILKLKENNLTLNYNEKTEMLLSNARQSRNIVLSTYANDLTKRWKSVQHMDAETKLAIGKSKQLRNLSMDAKRIKPTHKKTSENKFFKTKSQGKAAKKLKISREEHAEDDAGHVDKNRNHVNQTFVKTTSTKGIGHVEKAKSAPGVIAIPELGTQTTILRYTDKRYGLARTVAIDMGPETKLRNDTVVIN